MQKIAALFRKNHFSVKFIQYGLITVLAYLCYTNFQKGFAESWEIGFYLLGLALLLIECFVIPGFGIVGFSGIGLMLFVCFLIAVPNQGFDFTRIAEIDFYSAMSNFGLAILGSISLIFLLIPQIIQSKTFKRITLQTSMNSQLGFTSNTYSKKLIGKAGISETVLRPSGKVLIENVLYDASTTGKFIEKGAEIVVVNQEGSSLKVAEKV